MNFDIVHEDTYSVCELTPDFNKDDVEGLEKELSNNISKGKNFLLINLIALSSIPGSLADTLNNILEQVAEEEGSLVVAVEDDEFAGKLETLGITTTPTLSEAVDYIMMEALEKQLGEDEGEEEWE